MTNTGAVPAHRPDLSVSGTASADYVVNGDRTVVWLPARALRSRWPLADRQRHPQRHSSSTRRVRCLRCRSSSMAPASCRLAARRTTRTWAWSGWARWPNSRSSAATPMRATLTSSPAFSATRTTGRSIRRRVLPAGTPTEEGLVTLAITFKPTATGPRTTVLDQDQGRPGDWQHQPRRNWFADAEGEAARDDRLLDERSRHPRPLGR